MNLAPSFNHRHRIAAAIILLCALVYSTTMNPTVAFIDSGELVAVATTLGIAHPTGYPLFTILGRLAAALPIPLPVVTKLNVLGLFFVSLSAGLFFEMSILLWTTLVGRFSSKKREKDAEYSIVIASGLGSLVLAFSSTYWAQSAAVEVYSLHLLFLMAICLAFVKGMHETVQGSGSISRWLLLSGFLLGLSFANHMTTLLLGPALLFLLWSRLGFRRSTLLIAAKAAPFFALGLSVYLYLPIRSSLGPALDWGHPAEWERFLWHISGKQYRSWIFSGFESAQRQFDYFVRNFPNEFTWPALLFMILGLWALFRRGRTLLVFILMLIGGCLAYSINYDIHDIDSYFLLAFVGAALLVVAGMQHFMFTMFADVRRRFLAIAVAVAIPIVQFFSNKTAVDQSDNFLVEDYTRNILERVDSNAVVFSYQWDYFVSASYYFQQVMGVRPDVVVIDKELLRRSWYFIQLERRYPWLMEKSRQKVDAFLRELWKFEHDVPYDGNVIEASFNAMINDFIAKSLETRPVYFGPEIEPQFAPDLLKVPEGLLLRLRRGGEKATPKNPVMEFRSSRYQNRLTSGLLFQYQRILTLHAYFLKNQGELEQARRLIEKVAEFGPPFPPADQLRRELQIP